MKLTNKVKIEILTELLDKKIQAGYFTFLCPLVSHIIKFRELGYYHCNDVLIKPSGEFMPEITNGHYWIGRTVWWSESNEDLEQGKSLNEINREIMEEKVKYVKQLIEYYKQCKH